MPGVELAARVPMCHDEHMLSPDGVCVLLEGRAGGLDYGRVDKDT